MYGRSTAAPHVRKISSQLSLVYLRSFESTIDPFESHDHSFACTIR
jgi:hypothetical protein